MQDSRTHVIATLVVCAVALTVAGCTAASFPDAGASSSTTTSTATVSVSVSVSVGGSPPRGMIDR